MSQDALMRDHDPQVVVVLDPFVLKLTWIVNLSETMKVSNLWMKYYDGFGTLPMKVRPSRARILNNGNHLSRSS